MRATPADPSAATAQVAGSRRQQGAASLPCPPVGRIITPKTHRWLDRDRWPASQDERPILRERRGTQGACLAGNGWINGRIQDVLR